MTVRTWSPAGTSHGPHQGAWQIEPGVLTVPADGRRTAVSGTYDYISSELRKITVLSFAAACCVPAFN